MTERFRARLVNEPFGDPALYVELAFERRALLFDLGTLEPLSTRHLLRVTDVFVTHTHMDHFIGFDRLLRACLHQNKRVRLYGPPPFIDQLHHRLSAYTWNLLPGYATDLVLVATELGTEGHGRTATFRSQTAFACQDEHALRFVAPSLLDEPTMVVRATVLDHKIPALAFALEERAHVNIRKGGLEALGLPVGPWLADLKRAVASEAPHDHPIRVWWREGSAIRERHHPLGALKQLVTTTPGQKIAYVVDAGYHAANARAIVDLVRDADLLFIEAAFLDEDAAIAADRGHLTARQAGRLAREAGVKRVVPLHFSPRYVGREDVLRHELQEAFSSEGGGANACAGRSTGTLTTESTSSGATTENTTRSPKS
jgi:ribonuclease Z